MAIPGIFPDLSEKVSQSPLALYDSKHHLEIASSLKDNFKNRFKVFNEIAIVAQFVRRRRCDRNGSDCVSK
ncbi:unnamed protein product [Acanthoscelides obtectus]|uniref:Uncharacterized protein n=1 Tax=Acanthoscelides obtectus TaxID=200917 RepID=A0A9P0M856_ACAOB|nr:unnamed protein product [Acanthoscelides obtectus]CAK1688274.1 hypothetical protein AOBTE_LOCUS36662 [Acanthoscelides obtectus]